MEKKKKIIIDFEFILKSSETFLNESKSNPFYDKNVFFTKELRAANKRYEFQIIGNLGGWADDQSFGNETDYYIVSESYLERLKLGDKPNQIIDLENKINAKGNKHKKLKIISENTFLNFCKKRSDEINDTSTNHYISLVI
tara:strand:+ start:94 stop:516 length:423 start_codon:yes stop_codon:yes gene_type:complete